MFPTINVKETGNNLRRIMDQRGIRAKDVQEYLNLASVQSVYYWWNGTNMPTIDNLYALVTILVDYENVSSTDGLKGVEYLNENDTLIIFYSQCCEKIRAEYIEMIEKSRCEFKTYKLARTGKNALDFYIAVECGVLGSRGENQISIISKDKGFGAVSDFFRIQEELAGVTVRVASNVENALVALNAPEDEIRKKLIKVFKFEHF